MKVLLVQRRSGTLSVIKCGCENGGPAQGSTGKGRERILVLEMCWWGSEVCQPEGQAAVWGEGVIAMSYQGLQPLKEQLMRFTCPLAEVSLGVLGLEGTWDRSFESGHWSLAPAAGTIEVVFVWAGSDKAGSFHALLPSENNSYTAGKVWHSHGAELKV